MPTPSSSADARPVLPFHSRRVRAGLVLAVAAAIAYASLLTVTGESIAAAGPLGLFGVDKWLHAAAYGVLATTVAYAVARRGPLAAALLAVGVAVGYGLTVEVLQLGVPRRAFDVADLLANATGAILAGTLWAVVARRVRFD